MFILIRLKKTDCCFHFTLSFFVLFCFRFITVLYYLNDVEEGGETAFPVADNETFDMEVSGVQQASGYCNSYCNSYSSRCFTFIKNNARACVRIIDTFI